MISMQNKI